MNGSDGTFVDKDDNVLVRNLPKSNGTGVLIGGGTSNTPRRGGPVGPPLSARHTLTGRA